MVSFPLTYPIRWTGLAGYGFKINSLTQKHITSGSSSDAWESNVYVRKHNIVGDTQYFVLECYEDNIIWNNSAAKLLETAALAGSAVRLWLVEQPRTLDIQVFIIDIKVEYLKGTPTYREFTVTVKEEMT